MPIIQNEFSDVKTLWGGMRRCLLLDDGTVNYYLDSNDSTLKEDGTDAVLDGSDGQVMVEIPKFWYKKEIDGDDVVFKVSDKSEADLELHPAFYRDRNGDGVAEEVDFRYMSAFMGSTASVTESLPNKTPRVHITIGDSRTACENRGTGWGLVDYNLIYAIQILYITEFGDPDSQTVIGRGYVDGNSSSTQTGSTLQYGNNTFGETTNKQQMSYRGIEDLWGNTFYWLDGLKTDDYDIMIGNVNFNDDGTGYERIVTGISSNVSGNISDVHDDADAGFIIKASNGNSNYDDKLYDYGNLYSSRIARFGASWTNDSSGGLFLLQLVDSASISYAFISLRLSF
ncbi:MAG: hypothetical protein ACQESN_11890 [Thermotogota bacterium]